MTNQMLPAASLTALIGAAQSYADDLESGLADGTYDDPADLDAVQAALAIAPTTVPDCAPAAPAMLAALQAAVWEVSQFEKRTGIPQFTKWLSDARAAIAAALPDAPDQGPTGDICPDCETTGTCEEHPFRGPTVETSADSPEMEAASFLLNEAENSDYCDGTSLAYAVGPGEAQFHMSADGQRFRVTVENITQEEG